MIARLQKNRSLLAVISVLAIFVVVFGVAIYKIAEGIENYTLPSGSIEVNSEYSSYVTGEVVKVSIKNNLNTTIYINNECPNEPLNVYFYENDKWGPVNDKTNENSCPNKARQIAIKPNGSETVSYQEWKNLFSKPGKYRILAAVSGFRSYPYQDILVSAPVEPIPMPAPTPTVLQRFNAPTKAPSATAAPTPTTTQTQPSPTPKPTKPPEDDD